MSAAPILLYSETGLANAKRPTLLSEARRGNREAFAEMVSPYVPALYRRARGLTGNSADAQDASQEALDLADCDQLVHRFAAAAA